MPIAELRAHVAHAYAEFYNECGYCWLEGEANAGEYGGGGYDYYVPVSELIGIEHPADGTMSPVVSNDGEYAPEPAYRNPFALTGAIPGFARERQSGAESFYNAYRYDVLLAMQVARPIDMIIISGIS